MPLYTIHNTLSFHICTAYEYRLIINGYTLKELQLNLFRSRRMGHLPSHGNRTSHSLFGCFDTLWLLLSTGNIFIIDVNVGTRTVYTYITPLPICPIKFPAPQITSDNSCDSCCFYGNSIYLVSIGRRLSCVCQIKWYPSRSLKTERNGPIAFF